jgi:hypothetical protein
MTGDLDVSGGQLHLTQGVDATRQRLEGRLSLSLGEWFLNELLGVPVRRDVLGKRTTRDLASAEATYRRCTQTSPGVKSLLAFSLAVGKDRVLRLSFVALDQSGERIETKDFEPGGPA